jgi:hypothetical protein
MVLWVPGLNRMVDPTVYQVNRPEVPTTIARALMIHLPDGLAAFDDADAGVTKDGPILCYAHHHPTRKFADRPICDTYQQHENRYRHVTYATWHCLSSHTASGKSAKYSVDSRESCWHAVSRQSREGVSSDGAGRSRRRNGFDTGVRL